MRNTIFNEQEIQQLRSETRGTADRIHFNNAGASLPPDVVVDRVIQYLQEEARYGGYEMEYKYKEELDGIYGLIARLINADADEIAVVENASTAWGLAFNGIAFKEGDVVITSEYEYETNLIGLLNVQQTYGVQFKVIANDENGDFSLSALEAAISPRTRLIAVTHVPSSAGGVLPVIAIGRIARKHGILYLVDACQSIGQLPIDVKAIDCDMLSVTGRKYLRAPRGTGFLYVRKKVQDELRSMFVDGHSAVSIRTDGYTLRPDGRRFELYEKSRALTLGLGKAVEYALAVGVDRIWQRVQYLAGLLREQLEAIDGITVHDMGAQKCGIVTFSVNGMECMAVKDRLATKGINVSVSRAKSTLLYMDKHHLSSVVRASVHYYNTEEEINMICEALAEI